MKGKVFAIIIVVLIIIISNCNWFSYYRELSDFDFSDNNNGTVTDNDTGLMWEVKTDTNKDDEYTWEEAKSYCDNLSLAGYSDWYLPSVAALMSIVCNDCSSYIYKSYFPNCQSGGYWSSTTFSSAALYIRFSDGNAHNRLKTTGTSYARCVR